MPPSSLINFLESKFARSIPNMQLPIRPDEPSRGLPDGATVVIVGGGLAGSCFARLLLMLCHKENRRINIYLVNSTGCNYCGGLVTNIAQEAMERLYKLNITDNLVLEKINSFVYVNREGHVKIELPTPITATLRTSRFGVTGFDDSIKHRILEGMEDYTKTSTFTRIEPTIVKNIIPPDGKSKKWRVVLSRRRPNGSPDELSADLVVLAAGFNSLDKPMINRYMQSTGFKPPPVLRACVTEIDTSTARYNRVGQHVYMIDGIVPGSILAFIPKGKNWLTLTSLNKVLSFEDLETLFNHPVVKEIIDLPNPAECLRCHVICPSFVFTGPSRHFYGDGWVAVGDLAGYGRVLKDGYFAAFVGAWYAVHTVFYHGTSRAHFERHYHGPLRRFNRENLLGIKLFNFNMFIGRQKWFNRLLLAAAKEERQKNPYGWAIHAAFRSLQTGLLPYLLICLLFVVGVFRYVLRHPFQAWRIFFAETGKTAAKAKKSLSAARKII